jgi:hypothetical protein
VKLFCPSCGTPLEFRFDDSFVRVCPSCRSAIARTDRGIDTLGAFADLAPAASGLRVSDTGRWQGLPFELAGRAEYAHPAGGSWEEWFLKLGDGRWAWLSHAHGTWAVTFPTAPARDLPGFEQITPGMVLLLGADPGVPLTVGERNAGTLQSAEGELPFLFVPGRPSRFVDASDDKGRFATLDYGPPGQTDPPGVYLGRRTNLIQLGLRIPDAPALEPARAAAGQRLACPNCGGSIELRVPERSLTVSCAYCGSLLDCEGPLAILARRSEVEQGDSPIALGSSGTFDGVSFTVVGRLRRQASYDGGLAAWDEYLLYAPGMGYRWLVRARGHYSFVSPLSPGAVAEDGARSVRHRGRTFKLFDRGKAEVSGVWGEFYWRVSLGESVATADYIAPPLMLSRESSDTELHWSLGVYQSHADVQRAFGLESLPDVASGVAPNQPFRHRHWAMVTVALAALLFVAVLIRALSASSRQVYVGKFRLGPEASGDSGTIALGGTSATTQPPYVLFTPPFELEARSNTAVELSLPLANDWAFAVVDLVHEATGEMRTYSTELSYYSGVEGGERWSEGSPVSTHLFAAGHAGSHVLRLELQTPTPSSRTLAVSVAQNVFALGQLGWVLLLLAIPGGLLAASHYAFERWRWSESDFASKAYGGDSDE